GGETDHPEDHPRSDHPRGPGPGGGLGLDEVGGGRRGRGGGGWGPRAFVSGKGGSAPVTGGPRDGWKRRGAQTRRRRQGGGAGGGGGSGERPAHLRRTVGGSQGGADGHHARRAVGRSQGGARAADGVPDAAGGMPAGLHREARARRRDRVRGGEGRGARFGR